MVRRWRVCFAVIGVALFTLQLVIFYFLNKSFQQGDHQDTTTEVPKLVQGNNIRSFLSLGQVNSVTIFPMDRHILELVSHHGHAMNFCSYFCQTEETTFATFNELFQNKDSFLKALKDANFNLFSNTQPDARRDALGMNVNLTTHMVFVKDDYVIHLVILYHHEGNFWWHGRLKFDLIDHLKMINSVRHSNISLRMTEGALEKFKIQEMVLDGSRLYFPMDLSSFIRDMEHSQFISCNYTRAKLFHKLYGSDESAAAVEFKKTARNLLVIAKQTLDKLGVPFWLSSGTCLGYFRQCDIFPHGKDVDIGIFIKDYNNLIVKRLILAGMKLKHSLGKVNDSLELSFIYNGIKLDIFFFYQEANYTWNGGLQTKSGKKFKYIFPKFSLCWSEFLGLKIRVPCQTQQYVEANYGLDWFRPVLHWDWKSSPFNVRENGRWPFTDWAQVIQQFDA